MLNKSAAQSLNRVVLVIYLIMNVLVSVGYLVEVFRGQRTWAYLLVFALFAFIPLIASFIVYFRKPSSNALKYFILVGYLLFYSFITFTSQHTLSFVYFFCILVSFFVYLNVKLIGVSCLIGFLINVGKVIYSYSVLNMSGADLITDYIIILASIALFSIALILSTKLAVRFNDDSADSHLAKQKDRELILSEVLKIAAGIEENSDGVRALVDDLAKSSDIISTAVNEISTGVIQTAESIQDQLVMSKNIHSLMVDTSELSDKMDALSKESLNTLNDGVGHVREISENSVVVNENSEYAYDRMQELTEKASEIQDIAEMITGISEQTTMLSLNASIEASRAGENGRGFLIVADEIRKLATQSQDSATGIARILADLEEKASQTSEAVITLKDTNVQQTILINSTKSVFEDLNEKMYEFTHDVGLVTQRISEIVTSNNKVIDSITQISALSEEATANVEEVNSMTDLNNDKTAQAHNLVNELANAANGFSKYL